jgi:ABC-type transport system involved in multi-copper enzyme maturation permease subunit
MSDTVAVLRAELFKLARRPTAWVLLAAVVVLNLIFSYLIPYLSYAGGSELDAGKTPADLLASTLPPQLIGNTLSGFPVFAGALALVFGALMTGSEYGWGTVKTQLTQRPSRAAVLGGQLLAVAVATLAAVLTQLAFGALAAGGIAVGHSRALAFPSLGVVLQGVAAGWLILLMWALLGATLGVLLRGVALPIGLGVVWVLGIENLVSGMASSVLAALQPLRDVLPGVNAGSLVTAVMPARVLDAPPGVNSSVAEPRALITLACYVIACTVVSLLVTRRRDVV